MSVVTMREQLVEFAMREFDAELEQLPFNKEDYAALRHAGDGKWFAMFITKPRSEFGLDGEGKATIVSVKIRDRALADVLLQQPGYLRGYPNPKWKWVSVVLDGTVPFEDICEWLRESYAATKPKPRARG